IVRLADKSRLDTPFLDISARVLSGGERGLLGFAFHPNFAENGEFFVNYTRPRTSLCTNAPPLGCTSDRNCETVVSRFRVMDGDPNLADPTSEEVLVEFCQPYSNHNAGQIAFSPLDGYLYIAIGDGGSGGDPCSSGQRANSLLGKMLRIDVDTQDEGLAYGIPADNPFVGEEGVRPEIWAFGLRNPWRFSFDSETGDMYIADVGQNAWEEINFQPGTSDGGENYEWRRREGDHNFNGGTSISAGVEVSPIYEYPHGGGAFRGCSITGGVVYRGCRMPEFQGVYFFADYCNDWIASMRVVDGGVTERQDRTAELSAGIAPRRINSVSSFGTDANGEIYVTTLDSAVYRIIPTSTVNFRPVAEAVSEPESGDVTLEDGEARVIVDGSNSDDGNDGTQELTFSWSRATGPDTLQILSPDDVRTEVVFVEEGRYRLRLTVSDGDLSDTDLITIDVEPGGTAYVRGDANTDGKVDITDGIFTLNFLFIGGRGPDCFAAADLDSNLRVELTDAVFEFNFLFLGGPAPGAPFPECGIEGADGIECDAFLPCAS
ncbi:MAG: PQQ-dependent sugar dehydrogenase, partial [Planctomycetota bacterium]